MQEDAVAFSEGGTGPLVAGVHAAVAERPDGSLIAVGRDTDIDGKMPISISVDAGESWTYSASPFPPVGTGQRPVLLTLREGPLLLISFTDQFNKDHNGFGEYPGDGIEVEDSAGRSRRLFGLFAALSENGGTTWPEKKLITDNREPEYLETGDSAPNLKGFWIGPNRAEHSGYMAATQTPDNTIHVISSHWYYRFNIQWIKTPPPPM
ncbi:MAG: exo-alpha-sialidase [Spirochaetales bacterium]|nr:exo-alpha-sialidase [Spirochaetales bacterium]